MQEWTERSLTEVDETKSACLATCNDSAHRYGGRGGRPGDLGSGACVSMFLNEVTTARCGDGDSDGTDIKTVKL